MFIRQRLMNEAGEASDNSGHIESEETEIGSDNELLEMSGEDALKQYGLDPAKYGIGKDEDAASGTDEQPQGSDEDKEAGQGTDEKSLLDQINAMELIHNGSPFKINSIDEVKNGIQMLKDYTVKTQALSEERKGWEAGKSQAESELNAAIEEFNKTQAGLEKQLKEFQQWQFTFNEMKESMPDVFEEVQRAFNSTSKHFSNPLVDQQLSAMSKRLEEAEKKLSSREDKLIVDSFESEYSSLNSIEQSMKELGIVINKEDVKKEWAKTGMPVKQVVGSLYFDQLAKAQASKSKLETTKAKVAAKPTGSAGASRPGNKTPAIKQTNNLYEYALDLAQKKYNYKVG